MEIEFRTEVILCGDHDDCSRFALRKHAEIGKANSPLMERYGTGSGCMTAAPCSQVDTPRDQEVIY